MRWANAVFFLIKQKEERKKKKARTCSPAYTGRDLMAMISHQTDFKNGGRADNVKAYHSFVDGDKPEAGAFLAEAQCRFEGQHYYHGSASVMRNSQHREEHY